MRKTAFIPKLEQHPNYDLSSRLSSLHSHFLSRTKWSFLYLSQHRWRDREAKLLHDVSSHPNVNLYKESKLTLGTSPETIGILIPKMLDVRDVHVQVSTSRPGIAGHPVQAASAVVHARPSIPPSPQIKLPTWRASGLVGVAEAAPVTAAITTSLKMAVVNCILP